LVEAERSRHARFALYAIGIRRNERLAHARTALSRVRSFLTVEPLGGIAVTVDVAHRPQGGKWLARAWAPGRAVAEQATAAIEALVAGLPYHREVREHALAIFDRLVEVLALKRHALRPLHELHDACRGFARVVADRAALDRLLDGRDDLP